MYLTNAERKIMECVWANGPLTAKALVAGLQDTTKWSKTTSYTMISRCVGKGFLRRDEPNFLCTPLVTKDEVAKWETNELLENDFRGSVALLLDSLAEDGKLEAKDVEALYRKLQEAR